MQKFQELKEQSMLLGLFGVASTSILQKYGKIFTSKREKYTLKNIDAKVFLKITK